MKAVEAKTRFLRRLQIAGQHVEALTPIVGVEAMLQFYAEDRADGCCLDEDGDMLLFSWGIYDWGNGLAFEVSIIRQLIVQDDENEEPQQLQLVFRFPPEAGSSAGEASQWCYSPDQLPEFRRFIMETTAFKAVGEMSPESVVMHYSRT
jgi:hypothetical protein